MKGLQFRVKPRSKDDTWNEWRWLPSVLGYTAVHWESVYFEFRWAEYDPHKPDFIAE